MRFAIIIDPNDQEADVHTAVSIYFARMTTPDTPTIEETFAAITVPGVLNPSIAQMQTVAHASDNPDSYAAQWMDKQARLVAGEAVVLNESERNYCIANGIPTNDSAPTGVLATSNQPSLLPGMPTGVAPASVWPVTTTPEAVAQPVGYGSPLDAEGMPWDSRIHASTKTRTVKGLWTKRKGVGDVEIARISAEIRGTMGAPAPGLVVPTPVSQAPFAHFDQKPVAGASDGFAEIAKMQALPTLPSLPTLPNAAQNDYAKFIDLVTANLHDPVANPTGKLTQDFVLNVVKHFGGESMAAIAHRPDIVTAAHNHIAGLLG